MKVHLALAAAIAQVSAGHADAVFPAAGEHVTYAIHDALPRGGAYDTMLTLSAGSTAAIHITAPGKGSASVVLDRGGPAHMDRSLGMGFHLLEVANAVVQAGLAGAGTATVIVGPPGGDPTTLQVSASGNTFTATGSVALPPPPMGGARGEDQGPPQGGPSEEPGREHTVSIRVVATIAGGKLITARGELAPADRRGPHDSWTIARK